MSAAETTFPVDVAADLVLRAEKAEAENRQLKRALAEAADWVDAGSQGVDDEECSAAHAFAKKLRKLAGVKPQRPGLTLWRHPVKGIAVAGTAREAAGYFGDTWARDAERVREEELTLTVAGLRAADPVECDHIRCGDPEGCACVCHGWSGEVTDSIAGWVEGRDAGLLSIDPARRTDVPRS